MSTAPHPSFAAVILDMDGLALDTEPLYTQAWRRAARALGVELTVEACSLLKGQHADHVRAEFQRMMGARFDPERFYPLAEAYWHEQVRAGGIAKMPGLDALLEFLENRRIPHVLATNSDRRYALECLGHSGVEVLLRGMVCRSDVAHGKPEPDIFLEAARRLQVEPEQCIVLEDSAAGLVAAHRAGTIPVLVNRDPVPPQSSALAVAAFQDLHGVVAWLQGAEPWCRLDQCPAGRMMA